jgi:hypothetical protein
MSSWQLLRRMIGFWQAIDNPVFLRETARPPIWHGIAAWMERSTGITLALGGLTCYFSTLLIFYLNSLLVILTGLLVIWTLLISLTLAPSVVQEREHRTWETLRMVPLSLETILLGKAGGALWWLRNLIRIMSGILLVVAIGIGLVSLIVVPGDTPAHPNQSGPPLLCALALVAPLTSATLFVFDRAQQFVLTVLAALAVSVSSSNVRTAMSGAIVAALITWMMDVGVASMLLALRTDAPVPPLLMLATFGPVVGYIAELPLLDMLLYVSVTLLVREIAVRGLWYWTVRTAGVL